MELLNLEKYRSQLRGYCELRQHENRQQMITVVKGDVVGNSKSSQAGISCRSFENGYWGFASNSSIEGEVIANVIRSSNHNAHDMAQQLPAKDFVLPETVATGEYTYFTSYEKQSDEQILAYAKKIDSLIQKKYPDLLSHMVRINMLDMEKLWLTTHGSQVHTMIPRAMIMVSMSVKDGQGHTVDIFDYVGVRGQFEDILQHDQKLHNKIEKLYENLRKKAEGVYATAGLKEVVMGPDLAGILAHEAIGHTTEADLVMAGSVAGDYLNQEVASELVTLVDFAHTYDGETLPVPVHIDDEGTPAEDTVLIDKGTLKGFMHNKESAGRFEVRPTGNARAYTFSDEPLIRMRNTAILPGQSRLEEMIESVDDGYYLVRSGGGQADSTSEFMFQIRLGFEIKGGKIGRAIRDTTISGIAFNLLKTVTAVSNDMNWESLGMCGKKQPIPVGMGGPAVKCQVHIGGR